MNAVTLPVRGQGLGSPPQANKNYLSIGVSQTAKELAFPPSVNGKVGDLLDTVVVVVATAATGTCSVIDGNGAGIPLTVANTPIGVYVIQLRIRARNATTPGWKITTGAGCTAVCCGQFS